DITQEDMRSIWECISCPVLIINSERGYPHRIGQDDTLQHFKNVETVNVPEASHWTHHDQLDTFLRLADDFLAS
ncbi:MAG: alpha/beta hydrolase, partial [Gammaproteobacteria bacterium]|nr:alpha/beta hydrolase [Gammaproteobacteria bacterium]